MDDEQHSRLRSHFLRYLERLGLERVNPEAKLLLGPRMEPANRKQQQSFGLKLARARRWLEKKGFRVARTSYKGLHAVPSSPAPYLHMVVWPASSRAAYVPEEQARLVSGPAFVIGFVFVESSLQNAELLYQTLAGPFKGQREGIG